MLEEKRINRQVFPQAPSPTITSFRRTGRPDAEAPLRLEEVRLGWRLGELFAPEECGMREGEWAYHCGLFCRNEMSCSTGLRYAAGRR